MSAVLCGAEQDGDLLVLRFAPRGGHAREIEDRVPLSDHGDMGTVHAVGRVLRLLRAARVRAPRDPYQLVRDRDAGPAQLRVTFTMDKGLGILVPARMTEVFLLSGQTGEGDARYSNFRRFTTSARIVPQ